MKYLIELKTKSADTVNEVFLASSESDDLASAFALGNALLKGLDATHFVRITEDKKEVVATLTNDKEVAGV